VTFAFPLKVLPTKVDGVGMSNTTRHIPRRRPPVPAQRASAPVATPSSDVSNRANRSNRSMNSANKVDTLRRLVAAGQYHVSPKYLAMKIFKAAGLEE
jgi:anti-sigma28 factor (negative regulator of flagellin synthesis)